MNKHFDMKFTKICHIFTWKMGFYRLSEWQEMHAQYITSLSFLAHLSTRCSGWAIVIDQCPAPMCLSVNNYLKNLLQQISMKFHRNDPWVMHFQKTSKIWCSWGQNWPGRGGHKLEHRNKENQLQNSSSLKLEGLELWYLVFSISLWTFINLFIWFLWGQNWLHPGGHKLEHRNKDQLQNSSLKLEGIELRFLVCSISL